MGPAVLLLSCEKMDDQREEAAPPSPAVPERVQEIAKDELERTKQPMQKVEIQSLNTRAYLDHTVVPILMDAMTAVAKDRCRATPNEALAQPNMHTHTLLLSMYSFDLLFRPADPIEFVAAFLLQNKDKYKQY